MIWGISLRPGQKFELASLKNRGGILKISSVIAGVKEIGETRVFVSYNEEKILMARLEESRMQASIDLFFRVEDKNIISVEGDFEVTLFGYFEPLEDSEKIMEDSESEEESSEIQKREESESEEIILPPKKKNLIT